MSEKEMSGKELLEQLCRGLDLEPAVEAEMDAQELLALAPVPSMHSPLPRARTTKSGASDASVARATIVRSPLIILCGIAVAGTIAAAALYDSGTHTAPRTSAVIAPRVSPPPAQVATVVAPEAPRYVKLVNPFDATEVFEFPPGTSKRDARDAMATLLLKRAAERQAQQQRRADLAADRAARYSGRGS